MFLSFQKKFTLPLIPPNFQIWFSLPFPPSNSKISIPPLKSVSSYTNDLEAEILPDKIGSALLQTSLTYKQLYGHEELLNNTASSLYI